MIRKNTARSGSLNASRRHDVGAGGGRSFMRGCRAWAVFALLVLGSLEGAFGQVTYSWRSEAVNGRWDYNDNWWNGSTTQAPQGGDVIRFGNGVQLTMTNDLPNANRYRIYFDSGSGARTISGSTANTFYDYGTATPLIQNDSGNTQTIGFKIINGNSASGNALDLVANSGDLVFNGDVSASGETRNIYAKGAANLYFNGAVTQESGATLNFNKEGNGTAFLTASNNYTGTTTVSAGVLQISNSYALGTTDNGTTVSSGAALQLGNNITISNEALTISGTGISSGGALRSVSGSNAYTGLITASSATTTVGAASGATLVISNVNSAGQEFWIVGDGTTIVAGGATNSGSGTAFVKTNTGTAILAASNAWSGAEYIRQGTVVLSNNNAFGTGGTTYLGALEGTATATLTLGNNNINSNSIIVEGTGTGVRTLGYQTASGTGTQLGSITLNTNSLAFNIATNGTVLFGGGVTVTTSAGGENRLAIDGGGTLIVTNSGSGIANSDRYQVRIGDGALVIGAGTIVARTNVAGVGHSIDMGESLTGGQVSATSTLAASNGVTVSNSIFVGTTGGAARVLSVAGAGTATYSGPIALNNANLTVTATNASDNVVITGAITNFTGSTEANNGLIKTGAGTLVLSGPSTYGGTTWVNAGVLRAVTNANAMGAGTLVLNGGNLELVASAGDISWNRNTVLSNNARITLDGLTNTGSTRNGYLGTLRMAGGHTLTVAKGTNYASGNVYLYFNTLTLDASGATIDTGTATYLQFSNGITGTDTSFTITNSALGVVVSNAISIGSGVMTKQGAALLELKSAVTGGIRLEGGSIYFADANAFGTGTFTIAPPSGSTVYIETTTTGVTTNARNNAMSWSGNFGFGNSGTTGSGLHLGTGSVTLAANVTNEVKKFSLTVGGAIGDSGSGYSLLKSGGGTLVLEASNTYSGGTILTAGTLALTNSGSLLSTGALTLTTNNLSVLFDISGISGSSTTIGSLSSYSGGNGSTNAAINLGSKTLIVGDSSSTTFSGYMSNSGSLVKQGSGTLTLAGSNSYTGTTTISAGGLQIGVGGALGEIGKGDITNNGTLIVNRTGTLNWSNNISGSGSLQKFGSSTLVLNSANSYNGGTLISVGTIVMSNNSAIGTGAVTLGTTTNAAGTNTLALGNGVVNTNAVYVTAGADHQRVREIAVKDAGTSATQLGTVYLLNTNTNSYMTFNVVTNATLNFGGGISVASNTTNTGMGRIIVTGGGTVIMTNNGSASTNTSAGFQMRIADGSLVIGSGAINGRTDSGTKGIDLGGLASGNSTNTAALYASNGVTVSESVYVVSANNTTPQRIMGIAGAGTATYAGAIYLAGVGLTVSADSGGTAVFNSMITNNSATGGYSTNTLTKIGVGTVVLTHNTNNYFGATTVREGTLRVTGVISNTPSVTVTNTGILSGSGRIATGTTTIEAGGTISPGNSPGTIFLANTVFGTNGNYNWQVYDATGTKGGTSGYDWISSTNGSLSITANASDKFNINLWTLSGVSPDVSGSALNFLSSGTNQWTLGTWTSISGFDTNYFRINTFATNGTGGFANAFAGTFSLTSSNNSIFLNYAGVSGTPIYSAASGTWSTNFTPALYQNAANWIFDGATGGAATNDIASATINTLGTLTFSNTAGSYTLSAASGSAGFDSASALAITGNIVNNSASAQTINLALGFSNAATINAAAGHMTFGGAISNGTSLTFTGASNNTVSGVISGAGSLVKDGAGTLTLSGNNTYTGGTLVSTGTLQVGAGGTSGSLTTSALTNNATLAFNRSDNLTASSYDISGTGALIKDGAGTLTLSGVNSYGGTTTISNGAISISVLANAGSNSGIGTNATVTFAGANATNTVLDYTGGNVTTDRTFAFSGTASSGEGGTINMASSNTVITATGAASGTGKMIISEGTLVLSNTTTPNSFAPAAIQVDTGATLQLADNNQIGNTTGLILNGGTFRTGTSSTGFSETLGTLTLSASSTIDLGAWTTGLRTLTFADSSAITWTGTLTITNWQGVANQSSTVAQILFGTNGLSDTQLGQIYFASQTTTGGQLLGGGGELVPIPEPRVYAAAVALLAAVGWRERKRLRALLKSRK